MPKPPASKSSKTNQVRINAGVWRSRLLKFPDVEGLRPTPERVRQTVFNWLGQDLTDKTCLDLFAGTGAFGFEALSRNAKNVVMVENSGLAYQSLMQNQQLLDAKNAQILRQDVLAFLNQSTQQFDVIFCDPPYHKAWLDKILSNLNQHLSSDGLVYIEAEFALESSELLNGWQLIKQNKAGNVYYHLLKSV
ncbi:MAG: 16S rRNA (guanine(966)-N(2))-methyltransferase RsmD [Methylotenera sp.]|nr:16S rRNA (guanine(966)-N(2))-methyltransferase RsmD [Methylotenera sp.]